MDTVQGPRQPKRWTEEEDAILHEEAIKQGKYIHPWAQLKTGIGSRQSWRTAPTRTAASAGSTKYAAA
ncbi:conserved hypothetical protein [Verticillium alfalfae VaMs.102]|uniref:Uncharacterized protein n=1 Tax=Verticillium alfalfae (strain VaMs.102 / ATCC MYA-4576 / FGSC 10136) TaxID=526221 RepID=C9SY22_VERA1|nr:conserved hypothetical protein [Verticillium alfalfae VaMs.102]EEY23687.1 conserved hypothetical protein [Verticillium alfalfae VaMs.102]